jgi:hypothetical protein
MMILFFTDVTNENTTPIQSDSESDDDDNAIIAAIVVPIAVVVLVIVAIVFETVRRKHAHKPQDVVELSSVAGMDEVLFW